MFCEGDIFDGLKLLKRCGSGAFGTVFYCQDVSEKKMALKIISKTQLGAYWERELKGVKNYRKITERNGSLLQIYHVKEDEKYFYYTMEPADSVSSTEYIPDTLARRLTYGALPENKLWSVLSKVFNDVKLIHESGFLHRDIKPDNILFVNGEPKLADIGLFSSLTVTVTQMAGTLDYIPPEIRSSSEHLDSTDKNIRQRNDLYALGMVIYCAVSGNSPRDYPTLPAKTNLKSPAIKYFYRLALILCDKDPLNRIVSLSDLSEEFARIEKTLKNGYNWRYQSGYLSKSLWRWLRSAFTHTGDWLSRYSELLFILILLLALLIHFIKLTT